MPNQQNSTQLEYVMLLPTALHTRSQANHLRAYLIRERGFCPSIFTSRLLMRCGTPCWVIAQLAEPTQPAEPTQHHTNPETLPNA